MSKFNSALAFVAASTLLANVAFAADAPVATTEATTEVTNTVAPEATDATATPAAK